MKNLLLTVAVIFLSNSIFSQQAIKVEKNGTGNPILYLPGFTTPGSVWYETIEHLNKKHENHLVSYAGFNGMDPIAMPWYSSIKEELISYIKTEGLTNLTLIGHSMGGNLALDLASELPDQISRLILVESIPCMRELMMPGVPANSITYENPYNQQMLDMSDEAFLQMVAGQSQNMTNDSTKINTLTQWAANSERKTYVYGYTDLLKLDLRDQLPSVKAKTLILGASFPDVEMVRLNYEKQYEKLESKEIAIASNSKHFIMFDQPEWLNSKINDFLKDEK